MIRSLPASTWWWQIAMLLAVFHTVQCAKSYTTDGLWEQVGDRTQAACKQFTCSADGYTWKQKSRPYVLYNNITACDALVKRGIKKIVYYGDSYMRHIYAAMLITLNGNYESGSMANPDSDKYCRYHTLFNEKRCNYFNLNHYGLVCDGRVFMDPLLTGIRDSIFHQTNDTVALWSMGNHKMKGDGHRYGINNPQAYQNFFENDGTCTHFRDNAKTLTGNIGENAPFTVWWISTHQRLKGYFADEFPDVVRKYNIDMREYFDSGKCGSVNYIDVFNMTDRLVLDYPEVANTLTFDQVHWGLEVNLLKAQIILNALLA